MPLYARRLVLRNCGRFTVVQSDFGADYRTHTHVTVEALYASLTRGVTWQSRPIILKQDTYSFAEDYDLSALPLWFLPGLFVDEHDRHALAQEHLDTNYFNVLHEIHPTTSSSFALDRETDGLKRKKRPQHVPTFGNWEGILPDRRLVTHALAVSRSHLEAFARNQTYLLGKKRTMMQMIDLGPILSGEDRSGHCSTPFLQVQSTDVDKFQSFEVLAGTVRYLILRGETQPDTEYVQFDPELAVPAFVFPNHLNWKKDQ